MTGTIGTEEVEVGVDVSAFSAFLQWVSFLLISLLLYLFLSPTADQDRYQDRDRDQDRDRGGGRRDRDGPRGGRHPPPPPAFSADDRRLRDGYQNVPTGPRAERGKPSNGLSDVTMSNSMPPPPVPSDLANGSDTYTPPMTDSDLSAIRSRYLGVDKKKRKIRKMNDRKFVFDWDAQDDTFAEDSPVAVGSNRQGAQVMFGRGRIAGMDDGGGSGPRKGSGGVVLADEMERRNAAKSGYDDRHWTEKPLDEMKERDWRIFREDFSISARGIDLCSLHPSWSLTF